MAQLDVARGRLVLRIVYDGAAFAGKTTSVRSLGKAYGRPVFSSETPDGRTLHFDWMDYEGGRFGSHVLGCQVVTVPGQAELLLRRNTLLATADVVVFVADSRRSHLAATFTALESLRALLAERSEPRPGLIVQANRRDDPEAVSLDELRDRLATGETVGVTESIATEGDGILQTFVLAVRLAIDRATAELDSGRLRTGPPEVDSSAELLAALERLETFPAGRSDPSAALDPSPATVAGEPIRSEAAAAEVILPDDRLASGRIWPPIEGRLMLHEARAEGAAPRRLPSGDWVAQQGRWFFHSAADAVSNPSEQARGALLEWARWHAAVRGYLSPRRCLSLVDQPDGRSRLWQTVRAEQSLARRLEQTLAVGSVAEIVHGLLESARGLEECRKGLVATRLPVALETVGVVDARPVYIGAIPPFDTLQRLLSRTHPPAFDLARLYGPLLTRIGFLASPKLPAVLDALREAAHVPDREELALALVSALSRRD